MDVYWLEQTAADVPAGDDWLTAGEAARLAGMRFPKRRADWRLGRWTAKRAVAAYLHVPGIEIRAAASGAPEAFLADQPAPATISLSHRAGRAICAVAPPGVALGCDLEIIEPRSAGFAADYFTLEEQALVAEASAADCPRLLALVWSAKESALKALREGLRLDTRSVVVSPTDVLRFAGEATWHPLDVRHTGGQIFHGWWKNTGAVVRTLVAAPPPHPPISLRSA